MWSPGYLARQRAAGEPAGQPPGPAVATLVTVATHTVTVVRCLEIGLIAVQVCVWRAFYLADPGRLAGPAAAVACAAGAVTALRRGWPRDRIALPDTAVHLALALSAGWWVPPPTRGDTASWLYIAVLDQLVLPALFAPARLATALAAASAAAYWGGGLLTGRASASSPLASAGFIFAVALAVCWGRAALGRRAAGADAALARADAQAREEYVLRLRSAERREHERLLHDTVLNTLTALGRSRPGGADVTGRCRADVGLVEEALGQAGHRFPGTPDGAAGLLATVQAAARDLRRRGLDVRVSASGPGLPADPAGGPGPAIPAAVVAATGQAVREALANVRGHSAVLVAWVTVEVRAGAGTDRLGHFLVTVRDDGAGFDPAQVPPSRLGLRRSIIERLADAGGQAWVESSPGAGTVVRLRWPRPGAAPAAGEVAGEAAQSC
jgi:signal transduction histidine kinase